MPKSLCLLFLIGISSVYAPPFANSSTTRTISCTTAIISTGMFVPIYTVSILQLTMLSWYLRIAFLGDWDFVNHRCQLFCQISKNYSFFSFAASSQYMVINGEWSQKQTEVIDLTDSSLKCTSFRQWLECFLKNPSEEVGHFFLTRLYNCWQISGTYA